MRPSYELLVDGKTSLLLTAGDVVQPAEKQYTELADSMFTATGADRLELEDGVEALGYYLQKGARRLISNTASGEDFDSFYDQVHQEVSETSLLSKLAADFSQAQQQPDTPVSSNFITRFLERREERRAREVELATRKKELQELRKVAEADLAIKITDLKTDDVVTLKTKTYDDSAISALTGKILGHKSAIGGSVTAQLEVEEETRTGRRVHDFTNPTMRRGDVINLEGSGSRFDIRHTQLRQIVRFRPLILSSMGRGHFIEQAIQRNRPTKYTTGKEELELKQLTIDGVDIFS